MRKYYFSGRITFHFAEMNGYIRCIRLVMVNFFSSARSEVICARSDVDNGGESNERGKNK